MKENIVGFDGIGDPKCGRTGKEKVRVTDTGYSAGNYPASTRYPAGY